MSREAPLPRSDFVVWRPISTRWADNDAYGHVNNAVYYGWFDTAVNAWLIDQQLLDIASGPVIRLVVAISCAYFAPLSFPGEVEIGLAVERIGSSSGTYWLGAFAKDAEMASAQGTFTHVYVDRSERRPILLPSRWRDRLQAIGR